jgi:hypothetical protein
VPRRLRARVWRLLLHYEPTGMGREAVSAKRQEYWDMTRAHGKGDGSEDDEKARRIVEGDVVRTCP